MAITFAHPHRKRRLVSLTPMIDVVFLLLVFFMLASKFTTEHAIELSSSAGVQGGTWDGAPRLLTIAPDALSFNGTPVSLPGLGSALVNAGVGDEQAILLRIEGNADVQRLTDTLDALDAAGFSNPVLLP